MPMNLMFDWSKFQVIRNCHKRLYSLVVMTTRLRKKNKAKKRDADCTFQNNHILGLAIQNRLLFGL